MIAGGAVQPGATILERAGALYAPILACLVGAVLRRRAPFRFTAVLLAVLWVLPALLALQALNLRFAWWSFPAGSPLLVRGMPLELLLGWAILWGVLPTIALGAGVVRRLLLLLTLDACIMPMCRAVVTLHRAWWIGEAVAALLVLLPALVIADWTERRIHVRGRAALQVLTAGLLFFYGLPEVLFALRPAAGWSPLFHLRHGPLPWLLDAMFLLAVPGISAAQEFADRGGGTPLPLDPPQRLVTSGIYRYCANPMQLFCTVTLLLWSALLRSPLFAWTAVLAVAYSAGLALWDEQTDLRARFGTPWLAYRRAVPAWRMRWRPFHAGPSATVFIAGTCDTCSLVGRWIECRKPLGLEVRDAESLHDGSVRRMRYDPGDGTPPEHGIRAFARVLEHLHLGYACLGLLLRLPLVWQFVQITLDASGLGSRSLRTPTQARGDEVCG
ncbi:methyltransferase family protein [Terriglobus sp.]|uniref:methyltransferase family protein n=1 Tax=Terriglobus sp. TaxID=1889013 RepID=UPI003B00545F